MFIKAGEINDSLPFGVHFNGFRGIRFYNFGQVRNLGLKCGSIQNWSGNSLGPGIVVLGFKKIRRIPIRLEQGIGSNLKTNISVIHAVQLHGIIPIICDKPFAFLVIIQIVLPLEEASMHLPIVHGLDSGLGFPGVFLILRRKFQCGDYAAHTMQHSYIGNIVCISVAGVEFPSDQFG